MSKKKHEHKELEQFVEKLSEDGQKSLIPLNNLELVKYKEFV